MTMVFLTALGVGGATIVGALIGFIFRKLSHKFSDIVLSFAAGVMMAAAVLGLIIPAVDYGTADYGLGWGLLIACAGISAPAPITVAVNYFGVTEFLELLAPTLAKSDAPRAAVVSSMASLQPNSPELVEALLAGDEARALEIGAALAEQGPRVGYLNYPSSKRALSRWVRRASVSDLYAGNGIPLNAVAPGTVLTAMTKELLATPEGVKMVDENVPMPLNGHSEPVVIARLLAWLASEENSHLAGQTIYCDGGADATLRGDDIWQS